MSSATRPAPPTSRTCPDAPSDEALVTAVATGNQRALAHLYDRHAAPLLGFAVRIIGDHQEAEAVILDSFTQVWRTAATFNAHRGSVISWLVTITRTRALDTVRRRTRRAVHEARATAADADATDGTDDADPLDVVTQVERARAVGAALQSLPPVQREAIALAFFRGLSHTEIARLKGLPLGTVKSRIRQAMERLRVVLGRLDHP